MFGTRARGALGFVLASMDQRSIRVAAVLAVAIVTVLAGADRASAGACHRRVPDPERLQHCVQARHRSDQLRRLPGRREQQDHHRSAGALHHLDVPGRQFRHHRPGGFFDLITVKNGTVSGYEIGVDLADSTRVSVLGVKATNNSIVGIWIGEGLVKSSEASGNDIGIEVDGDRGQVQQSTAHNNISIGIAALGDHCLVTMSFANGNGHGIVAGGNKCTVSYNTANSNGIAGIAAGYSDGGTGHLVTRNTATNNADVDFNIACPSDVTNNTSSGAIL